MGDRAFDPAASAGLFVGVSRFEDPKIRAVPYAVDDAVDLAHLFCLELGLVAPGRAQLALSGEPVKPQSQERLAALLAGGVRRGGARKPDLYDALEAFEEDLGGAGLAVFTAATHGVSDQGGTFLVAADSRRREQLDTALPFERLLDRLSRAVARGGPGSAGKQARGRGLVLLDACRGRLAEGERGGGDAAAAGAAQGFARAIARSHGLVVLSGAVLGDPTYDDPRRGNGVFTAAVLDGLHGQAAPGPEGWITASTLADFAGRRVLDWIEREWPQYAAGTTGIERRIDTLAAELPLAEHPGAKREHHRERVGKALDGFADLVGKTRGAVLTGAHWDEARALLAVDSPDPETEKLLRMVEQLTETDIAQWVLQAYLEKMRGGEARARPVAPVVPVKGPPPAKRAAPAPVEPVIPGSGRRQPHGSGWKEAKWEIAAVLVSVAVVLVVAGDFIFRVIPERQRLTEQELAARREAAKQPPPSPASTEPAAGAVAKGPGGLGMRLRYVPSGTYWIGSPESEEARYTNETRHRVKLTRGFWLGETEVTQEQWQAVMRAAPWFFKSCGSKCPVENVNWYAAVAFANAVSARESLARCYEPSGCTGTPGGGDYECKAVSFAGLGCPGYRLPTEAEWEVAARAVPAGQDVPDPIHTGRLTLLGANNAPELERIAWYGGNSGVEYPGGFDCSAWQERPASQAATKSCGPHPVGLKDANRWGFRDLLGNVWEWTGDWNVDYGRGLAEDPTGPSRGSLRVYHGGSWSSNARLVRAAYRMRYAPSIRWSDLGFRLARGQGLRSSPAARSAK